MTSKKLTTKSGRLRSSITLAQDMLMRSDLMRIGGRSHGPVFAHHR